MDEKLKEAQKKAIEFWNKYDKKQKTLMVSITAVVIVTLIILAVVLTRTKYVELITCEDKVTAADVTTALNDAGIEYVPEADGLRIMVPEERWNEASYLIAQSGMTATAYTFEDYMADGGFSATSEDRMRAYQKYLEDKMEATIESFDYVSDANVMFTMPSNKLTVLDRDEETYVSVKLKLKKSMPENGAENLAKYVATSVGNDTTNGVTIIDETGRTLFAGSDSYEDGSVISASRETEIRNRFNNEVINNVSKALQTLGIYSTVSVAPNLDINFDTVDILDTEYYNPDEVKDSEYIYEQEGGTSSGGIPGTDSNDDDTGYMIELGEGSNNSVFINKTDYAVSSKITHTKGQQGVCNRENSTLAVVVNSYVYHDRTKLEESGALDDITWDEYIANNSEITVMEIPEYVTRVIATASGIDIEDITVAGSLIPVFEETGDDGEFVQNILPIVLAVIILALLGFMVWRSLRPVEVNEIEPELSVEELLSATREKQNTVEDIDLEEKSETRKAIEKFVTENPESAALLLRNWLNDDWG